MTIILNTKGIKQHINTLWQHQHDKKILSEEFRKFMYIYFTISLNPFKFFGYIAQNEKKMQSKIKYNAHLDEQTILILSQILNEFHFKGWKND